MRGGGAAEKGKTGRVGACPVTLSAINKINNKRQCKAHVTGQREGGGRGRGRAGERHRESAEQLSKLPTKQLTLQAGRREREKEGERGMDRQQLGEREPAVRGED